jgi:hypothetical protein
VFHTHYHFTKAPIGYLTRIWYQHFAVASALVVLGKESSLLCLSMEQVIMGICISKNLWEQYGFVCPQIPAEKYSWVSQQRKKFEHDHSQGTAELILHKNSHFAPEFSSKYWSKVAKNAVSLDRWWIWHREQVHQLESNPCRESYTQSRKYQH